MATQYSKDFSILLTKVNTSNSKKDISIVTGLNKTVQQIEQVCKVNPGELMADPYFGSNYYDYSFMGSFQKPALEASIKNSIEYGIPSLRKVSVQLTESNDIYMSFLVKFNQTDLVNTQNNLQCTIEVPVQ